MAADPIAESDISISELVNELAWREIEMDAMQESIVELEREMVGWRQLNAGSNWEFSRDYLDELVKLSRFMYLRNPLVNHAVEVGRHYVMGTGVNWKAPESIEPAITAFWGDPANRIELTSPVAQLDRARDLDVDGNVFLALFTNAVTGRVKVRTIAMHEIREVIADPEDWCSIQFYRRCWTQCALSQRTGRVEETMMEAFYPDWRYQPRQRPATIGGKPVHWDAPVYHVKSGGLGHQHYGLPMAYAAFDWAQAVTKDLSNYATIKQALARFALKVTGPKSKAAVAAAKARLSTNAAPGVPNTNPPPSPGATFVAADGYDLTPIKTAGAQPSPEEGRRLGLMVAAGVGIPETILFGDADSGNLATAKTLDRPTELKMRARQTFWEEVFTDILNYVVDQAITTTRGPLRRLGTATTDDDGNLIVVMRTDPETGEPYDRHLDLDFPNILDRDINERINAIVTAATLGGHPATGTLTSRMLSELLMEALGIDDIDHEIDELFPDDSDEPGNVEQPEEALIEALRELRAAVKEMHT